LRIESLKLDAYRLGGEVPINANLFGIAPFRPGGCLTAEYIQIVDAVVCRVPDDFVEFFWV